MREITHIEVITSNYDEKQKLQVTFLEFGVEDKKVYKPEYIEEERDRIAKSLQKIDEDLLKYPVDKMFLGKIKFLNNQKAELQSRSEFVDFLEQKFRENNLL